MKPFENPLVLDLKDPDFDLLQADLEDDDDDDEEGDDYADDDIE